MNKHAAGVGRRAAAGGIALMARKVSAWTAIVKKSDGNVIQETRRR
jgi:hypothetical protein